MEQTTIILHKISVSYDNMMLWVGVSGLDVPDAPAIFAYTADNGRKLYAEKMTRVSIEPSSCNLGPATNHTLWHMLFVFPLEALPTKIAFYEEGTEEADSFSSRQQTSSLPLVPGKFFPLDSNVQNSFYHIQNSSYVITWGNNPNTLSFCKAGWLLQRGAFAWRRWIGMLIRAFSDRNARAGVKLSIYHALFKMLFRKQCMVISDRPNAAGDNGEEFYRYMLEHHRKEWKVYFAIAPDCADGKRLGQQRDGRVIAPGGFLYRMLWLGGAVIVSSQGEDRIFAPYGTRNPYVRTYNYDTRFIFLQHGVTKDDQTLWLNSYRKHIALFVTSTKEEYDAILNGAYGYTEEEVVLTGMPRFDGLRQQTEKRITVMFTWRKSLVEEPDQHGNRALKQGFEDSLYMEMLTDILCNEKLMRRFREAGYSVHVKLHPCMKQAERYFRNMEGIVVDGESVSYREMFEKSALLITDYSSAVFDFAYLHKPVLYYQKDKEQFFDGTHMYRQGYFDYEREGFGPVVYTGEALEQQLLHMVLGENEKLPKMESCYVKRVEETFAYRDRENCRRLYEAIERMM